MPIIIKPTEPRVPKGAEPPKFKRGQNVVISGAIYVLGGTEWDKEYKEWQYRARNKTTNNSLVAPVSEYLIKPVPEAKDE